MSDWWDDTGPGDVSPPGTGGWVRQSGWGSRPDVPEYDPRVLDLRPELPPAPEERPETPTRAPKQDKDRHGLHVVPEPPPPPASVFVDAPSPREGLRMLAGVLLEHYERLTKGGDDTEP